MKKITKGICLNDRKMYCYPHRRIETWIELKGVIMIDTLQQLKERLNKYEDEEPQECSSGRKYNNYTRSSVRWRKFSPFMEELL